jgi:hypothetical protein
MIYVLFSKYCKGELIKDGEMGGECSTHGRDEEFVQTFIRKT